LRIQKVGKITGCGEEGAHHAVLNGMEGVKMDRKLILKTRSVYQTHREPGIGETFWKEKKWEHDRTGRLGTLSICRTYPFWEET